MLSHSPHAVFAGIVGWFGLALVALCSLDNLAKLPGFDRNVYAIDDCEERDDAHWRATEAALRKARDEAEAASHAKSRFLAAMSHEIRTPMGGILGMIGLLREMPMKEEQQTYVEAMEFSARALVTLVDDILDFSKIEAGKLQIACEPFSIRNCVAHAAQLLAPDAAAKGLSFALAVSPDVPEYLRGDEMRLRQIVLNLLSNAVKFTHAGGIEVDVFVASGAAGSRRQMLAIRVTDTGIGFDPKAAPRLFSEFERSDGGLAQPGGSGLGLAISQRLARAMGGDIVAESSLREGATFTAFMPFEAGTRAPVPRPPNTLKRESIAGTFRVLIAEDNRINALMAAKVVERAGGTFAVVEDGRDAVTAMLEVIQHRRPAFDLILMDVVMPDVDGLTASRTIKWLYAERPGLTAPPIIAMTANAYPADRERCREAGMDDFIAKPFEVQHLEAVLRRWAPGRAIDATPAA